MLRILVWNPIPSTSTCSLNNKCCCWLRLAVLQLAVAVAVAAAAIDPVAVAVDVVERRSAGIHQTIAALKKGLKKG